MYCNSRILGIAIHLQGSCYMFSICDYNFSEAFTMLWFWDALDSAFCP